MNNYDDKYNEEYDKDMRRIANFLGKISDAVEMIAFMSMMVGFISVLWFCFNVGKWF